MNSQIIALIMNGVVQVTMSVGICTAAIKFHKAELLWFLLIPSIMQLSC